MVITYLQPIKTDEHHVALGIITCQANNELTACEVKSVRILRKARAYSNNALFLTEAHTGMVQALQSTQNEQNEKLHMLDFALSASEFNALFFGVKNNSAF